MVPIEPFTELNQLSFGTNLFYKNTIFTPKMILRVDTTRFPVVHRGASRASRGYTRSVWLLVWPRGPRSSPSERSAAARGAHRLSASVSPLVHNALMAAGQPRCSCSKVASEAG